MGSALETASKPSTPSIRPEAAILNCHITSETKTLLNYNAYTETLLNIDILYIAVQFNRVKTFNSKSFLCKNILRDKNT